MQSRVMGMKPRTANLVLRICDDTGNATEYKVVPVKEVEPGMRIFALRKPDGTEYQVGHDITGARECECPGWQKHHHCKHVDALTALGILDNEAFSALEKRRLEVAGREEAQLGWEAGTSQRLREWEKRLTDWEARLDQRASGKKQPRKRQRMPERIARRKKVGMA
jgi:hypothetical protein